MKSKIATLAALAIVSLSNVNAQSSAYKVTNWEGNKTSAITFTFDDCLANQYKTAVPILDKYGYKASFYIVTNWMAYSSTDHYTWANAQSMAANGHEIGSHTVSHANLNTSTYIDEMANSQSTIQSNANVDCQTIVYPNCIAPSSETECAKYYIGGRICNGQIEGPTPSNYFEIGSLICGNQGSYNSTSSFQTAFQSCKNKSGWAVFLIHEIDNGSGYSPLSSTILDEALSYLKTNDADYWVTTFGNAIKYSKERNAATLSELTNTSSAITMTVSDNLDDKIYNYPLTISRALPSGWSEVSVTQNGKAMESSISNGYIYFQAIPDGGTVTITPSATEVLPTVSFTNPQSATTWSVDSTYSISWNMSESTATNCILYWNSVSSTALAVSSVTASSEWSTDDGTFSWSASNVLTEGSDSRWAAASSPYAGQWICLDLGSATTVAGIKIDENDEWGAISGFEVQYDNNDGNWTTVYKGTTIGENLTCSFSAVTAQRVRIYITSAENVNINYIGLYGIGKTAIYSAITSTGSYNWTIPAKYAGTEGTLSITSAAGSLLAESKTITIKQANQSSESGSSTTPISTENGYYTGPSCDGEGTGAYYTGIYKDLFVDVLGKTESAVQSKIDGLWSHFFTPGGTNAVYYEVGDDMAYIYDTGNQDVRTEGMSYGMMICVQLDHQTEFNKLWRWAKKYMQYQSGNWDGYFAWQCSTDGTVKGSSCASDGEEYFITALLFASNRWGNDGEIDYNAEAQNILKKIQEKTGNGGVYSLFNKTNHLVTFVPYYSSADYTDPSYCLPAFLELWARWSDTNNDFWYQAADAARALLKNSCNTTTGLFPDYSDFSGSPYLGEYAGYDSKRYQYDAIRCAMNVGMDFNWFRSDSTNQNAMMTRLMTFFKNDGYTHGYFDWDGSNADGSYSAGIAGANGVGCFALSDNSLAKENLNKLWNMSAPTGQWRYYNGMVYMLSMLHVSGNFKIYKPVPTTIDTTITGVDEVEFNGDVYTSSTSFTTLYNCKYYNVTIDIIHSGIANNDADVMTIAPNPISDYLTINTNEDVLDVEIIDALGNRLIEMTNTKTVDTSNLNNGIYIVKVHFKDRVLIEKVIK